MKGPTMNRLTRSTFNALAKAARYDSGSSFLDSGSAYGRWHEAPPVKTEVATATLDVYGDECHGGTLETAHYLAEQCTYNAKLQAAFRRWEKRQSGDWFALGREFMERRGYVLQSRDNVYNGENDLTQVYVWEVWTPAGEECDDWIYAESAVFVVYVHTGCDVRGGYSYPVFLETRGEYSCVTDLVCEFYIAEARGLDDDECREIDQRWQCGYSGWPFGRVRDDVKRWFPATLSPDKTTICAVLESGHAVRIGVAAPISC